VAPPSNLTYSPSTVVCWVGQICASALPTSSGGAVVSYSILPALPSGLYLKPDGSIYGAAPAAHLQTTYTITATNTGGSTTAAVQLSVNSLAQVPGSIDISLLDQLAVTVTGTGLTQYQYKVGADPCAQSSGYSPAIQIATPITDPVTAYLDTTVYLCVLGGDALGNWQPIPSMGTLRDATVPYSVSPTSTTTLLRLFDADPGVYATTGDIVVSALSGTTYNGVCTACQVLDPATGTFGAAVSNVSNGQVLRLRHVAATTPSTETSTTLSWTSLGQPAGTWTLKSFTKGATCPPSQRRVFLTASTFNANLGGLSGADAHCQAEANSAGLGGVWLAALGSITTGLPLNRLNNATYCSLQGRAVIAAKNFVGPLTTDVRGGGINPCDYTCAQYFPIKPRAAQHYWWGGTDYDCAGWTSQTTSSAYPWLSTEWGRVAAFTHADPTWGWFQLTTGGSGINGCPTLERLLCFEQ
jgi:hypothetical protein